MTFNFASRRGMLFLNVCLLLSQSTMAYVYPLSNESIREAYSLGARQASLGADFLAQYTHTIPKLKVGASYISLVRIETPFTQVATHASRTMNYSAQDAVRDFLNKPAVFRIHMEICYMPDAPPDSVKFKVIQNKNEVIPSLTERLPYYPATNKHTRLPSIGETVELEFKPEKLDSSTLTILIDTPDGQHAETEFPLQTLR